MFLVVVTVRDDFVEQMCLNRCMDRLQEVRPSHKSYMKSVPRGESSFNRGEEPSFSAFFLKGLMTPQT